MIHYAAAAAPSGLVLNTGHIIAFLAALIVIFLLVSLIAHSGSLHRGETGKLVTLAVGIVTVLVIWAAVTSPNPQAIGAAILHAFTSFH
jgi:hypothetical protein